MKKRLLITSIVMMLVVAVALSTATYAWFTSNATVTANNINLTAATSDAPAFGISWTNSGYSSSLASITGPATSFNPLVPATYFTDTVTEGDEEDLHDQTTTAVRFATATMRQEGGAELYNSPVLFWDTAEEAKNEDLRQSTYSTNAKPYIWNNGTNYSFWIKNLSTSIDQSNLYASATVTGAASDLVRIAIFVGGNLYGILGYTYTYTPVGNEATYSSGTTYYKAVTNGYIPDATVTGDNFADKKATLFTRSEAPIAAQVYHGTVTADQPVLTTHTAASRSIGLGAFTAEQAKEITVYVWLDGKYLDDDTQDLGANIALSFSSTDPYAA